MPGGFRHPGLEGDFRRGTGREVNRLLRHPLRTDPDFQHVLKRPPGKVFHDCDAGDRGAGGRKRRGDFDILHGRVGRVEVVGTDNKGMKAFPGPVKDRLGIKPPGRFLAVGEKIKFLKPVRAPRDHFPGFAENGREIRERLAGKNAFHHLARDAVIERRLGDEQLRGAPDRHHRHIVARLQLGDHRERLRFGGFQTGDAVDPARHAHRIVNGENDRPRHVAAKQPGRAR